MKEFIRLFNRRQFFEAHETLESLWLETEGEAKNFYKGLIQCAVAFVHLQRGNLKGARKLLGSAVAYLKNYLPCYEQINTGKLLQEFEDFFAAGPADAEQAPKIVQV